MTQLLVAHAAAGVRHAQQHGRAAPQRLDVHGAARPVVLQRVAQQVEQHLAQPRGVGHHVLGECALLDAHLMLLQQWRDHWQRLCDQRLQVHRRERDDHFAALQCRQAEHVVDERQQVLPRRSDVFQLAPPRRTGGVGAGFVSDQQLRKTEHRVQRRAQLVAHARQKFRLGSTFAQRDLALAAHGVGGADGGDVPIDADAAASVAAFNVGFVDVHRARSQPANAPVRPQHTEFMLDDVAACQRILRHAFGTSAVFGVHAGQPLCRRHRHWHWRAATQAPHLFVPEHVAGSQILFPGSEARRARCQCHAVLRALQCQLGAAAFREVDDDAKKHRAVAAGFELRVREDLAHFTVGAARAEVQFQALMAAFQPALHAVLDARRVFGQCITIEPFPHRGCRRLQVQAVQGAQLLAPEGAILARFMDPVADAGGAGRGFEAPPHFFGTAPLGLTLGHVQPDAHESHGPAGSVAQCRAAQQLRPPAAIGMAKARLHVDRLVAIQGRPGGGQQARQVVGVDQGLNFHPRQPFDARLQAQRQPAVPVVVHTVRLQVMAPKRDATQFDGQRELRFAFAGRGCQRIGLAVVHHQPEHALGLTVDAVDHHPLRMDAANGAVKGAHAVARCIAAGLLE